MIPHVVHMVVLESASRVVVVVGVHEGGFIMFKSIVQELLNIQQFSH